MEKKLFKLKNKIKEIIIILILPLLTTLLTILPEHIKKPLILNIKDPAWWQYLTQSFVHLNWNHLIFNLIGYFLCILPIIFFVNKIKIKKEFYALFLFLLLTLPLISSTIQINFYPSLIKDSKELYSAGASGIVSALVGFMMTLWTMYLNKINKKINFGKRMFLAQINFITLIIFYQYKGGESPEFIFSFILLIIILTTMINHLKIGLIQIAKEYKKDYRSASILIITPLLFILALGILFPKTEFIIENENFIDFPMHYVGIFYGIAISSFYFIFINRKWKNEKNTKNKAEKF